MFRRPKPKPPLAQVESLVDAAVLIMEAYWRDETFQPTASDLERFRSMEQRLSHARAWMRRLHIRMDRRFHGQPEVNERSWKW
jgi:hypothetical protein